MLSAIVAALDNVPTALAGPVALAVNVREVLALASTGPRIWVVEPRGAAGANQTIGAVVQDREQRFGVLTLVSTNAAATAGELLAMGEVLRSEVHDALLGIKPATDSGPVEYVRDGLVQAADATLYWLDEFRFTSQICSN